MANSRIDQADSKAMLAHMREVEAGKQQKQNEGQATQTGKPDVKSMLARMQEVEKRKNQKQENRGLIAPGGMVPRTKTDASDGRESEIGVRVSDITYANYGDLAARAQKEYDDYLASDEYKAGQQSRMQQYLEKHRWDGLIAGLGSGSTVPSAASVQELTDPRAEELKAKAEHYKNLAEQEANQKVMDAALAELESWSDEDKRNLADYVAQRRNTQIANMFGAQQFDTYNLNPIVQKYGIDKVRQMAEVFERQQNEDMAKQVEETSRAAVDGGFWNGAGHSAASVGANLIGSMTALPGRVLELQNRTGQFPTLQKYTPYDMPGLYAGTVRGQVAENISGDQYDMLGNKVSDGGALRQAAAYAYQGLMSSADSLARAALGGGNKVVSLGLAATGSFGQTMSDASARGAAPGQAVLLGVINGGLEVATEYLPLDEILKVVKGSPVSGKQLLKNVFKQAAIEVTEEEVSFLGSLLAEAVVLQEKSGYRQKIAEAVAGGATYEDARDKANWDVILEAAETAITSAFSGGISAGVSSGAANINNWAAEKVAQQNPGNPDARVELADPTVDFEKETWDLCDRLAKATGRNIKLYQNYGTEEGIDNGYYEDGVIYVNTESADPVAQIISHELTHSVEFAQEYEELSRLVLGRIEAMGGDLKQLRQSKADLYAKNGHALNSQAEIDQEIVAEYVAQNLLTNEQQIMEAARKNRTLIEKIKAWVDKLLGALGNKDAAERAYLTNVQNLYARALQQTQNATVQSATQTVPAAVQTQGTGMQEQGAAQESAEGFEDDEAPNWDDPVQVRTWAQNMLSSGQITNEEFNGYIDLAEQLAEEKAGRENFAGDNDRKFSISNISGEKADYGKGVILDTDIFDGVKPRAWGNVLSNYVYNNLAGKELTVYDENGNPETIYLAKKNDRVRKDGAKNSHKVLDKLAGYRGDQIRAQAIVQLSEVLETSRYEKNTDDHSHQWLDENGWIFRKVYLQTKDGKIYEATLNIADGRNQKTLYEVNQIHQIDKKETPASIPSTDNNQRSRYQEPRMGGTQSEVTGEMIADNGKTVKRQYSFAGPGARTANSQTLAEAKALDEAGAANETIRQQTGWFKGMDGKWRFEVDDSTSRINENIAENRDLQPVRITEKKTDAAIAANPSPGADRNTAPIFENSVPQDSQNVKRQMSISPTVNRKNVADDLRGILSRGGDVSELRRYINQLERGGGNTERSGRNAYQKGDLAERNGAQRIIQAAKRSGISVEEYLRQNWEQYDVDGQWNEEARAALEQERRGRRYSVSETEEPTEQKTAEQIRQEMPTKARNYLQGAQRKLLNELQNRLGINKFTNREDLQKIVEEVADAYLTTGTVEDGKMGELFDRAYAGGIIRDAEFYEQYKEIKTHLRKTAVTISEGDSHDIADFQDFKRRSWGTLRIVKEGGLPVDSAYHELNEMAPELFPESITHPADQLVRMAEVGRSIQVSEKNLDEYYGDDRENFRKFARNDFENAVAEVMGDLRQVKRYIDEESDQAETAPTTPEEAAEYYRQLKDARRAYEKVQAKNLLTPHDEMQVGRLLKGEILPEHLDPEKDFVKGITAVYEAKKEYDRLCKLLAEYKRTVRAGYRDKADQHLETANEWKDKKIGLAYSRETMERNIDDIVPDEEIAQAIKREYFEAVHVSEAEATRFKTEFRNRVRGLNLSRKIKKGNLVSEAHAVQLLGEAEDNIRVLQKAKGRMKMRDGKTLDEWRSVIAELWKENPGLDEKKIRRAVEEFRKIYDELFEKMNDVRIRNGYEPVNYRQGYFPHFQPGEGDGILGAFGKALNIDTQVAALPTTINGLTHTFKPGIQWFGNAQERLGFNTAYDAIEGFDKYIEGVASVIYQTENIQKLRALAGQIRYRTTEEGIRRQVDEIRARDNLSEEEKQVQINSIYEHGKYTLSNFVNELDEYTNLLANKKSKLDRTMEAMMGRKAYTVMKAWEARVGANMIAGNLSSAMTNFIPLTQAGAQMDKFSLIKGMAATLKAYKEDDGIVGMSSFLTNRRGSDPLVQTWVQKASKVMGTPMELIDGFTADSIVRAAYFQNLKRGLSEAEAMHQADVFASHVMADRSKGAMPTLFESKNPIFKAFTQFQLEVNNQFSEVFKDLPRGHREKGLAALTLVLLKYFLGAFLYNEVYEYFVGRRPALDPFGILNDTVGDLTGYELPNLVEWGTNAIKDEETSFQTEKVGVGKAGTNLAGTLMGELPFSSGLTLLGIETDGGRIPASSAVPDLTALWDAATTEGWSAEKRWKEAQDELNKLAYVIPPFGGNQIGKLWKGIKAFAEGGSYSVDAEGNDILQYPIYKDDPADAFWNAARMGIFGKSALPEAQDWVDSGFNSLGAKQTAVYQDMVAAGVDDRDAYALIRQMEAMQEKAEKYWVLDDSYISQEGKTIVYYGLLASDSERELMDSLADAGAEQSEIGTLMMELKKASRLKGNEKREAQQNALAGVSMTDEEKVLVVGSILGTELTTESGKPTTYANFLTATSRGLGVDDFMDMRSKGVDVEDYLELTDSGINCSAALKLTYDLYELEEREDVEDADYWRLAVKSSDNEAVQLSLLAGRMSDAMFEKASMAYELDISPDMFVTYYEKRSEYDADGNGSYTQAEVKSVIDAMGKGYTNEQKGILWQMATGSKSTKNNPYSKSAGQKWLDAKAAAKEKEE